MKVKLKDLDNDVPGIYKLTFPNGKIYIGMSNNIKRRMYEHNNNTHKTLSQCDKAIKQFGKFEEIEILEIIKDTKIREEREKYWINYFNSTNPIIGYNISNGGEERPTGEQSTNSVFSNNEVLDIRKRRFLGERKCDVYKDYNNRSFATFEHIWLGRGYSNIGTEYLIKSNTLSRQEYSSKANRGSNNNKAKLTETDVINIRKRFDNGEDWKSIHKDYNYVGLQTIRRICKRETWTYIL